MSSAPAKRTPAETVQDFIRTYNEHDMAANHALIDPAFVRYGQTTGWQPWGTTITAASSRPSSPHLPTSTGN